MTNIALFFVTTFIYFVVWYVFSILSGKPYPGDKKLLKIAALIALLCVPFNICGDVFTVLGNAEGRNVYSVFSLYQKAEIDAFAAVGVYQEAKQNAMTVTGLAFQKAGCDALMLIGVPLYQRAGGDANNLIGLSVYQRADGTASTFFGITGYQKAGKAAGMVAGLTGYQRAGIEAGVLLGVALYQKVGKKMLTAERAFGTLSFLKAPTPQQ